jgi:hypothetical protein
MTTSARGRVAAPQLDPGASVFTTGMAAGNLTAGSVLIGATLHMLCAAPGTRGAAMTSASPRDEFVLERRVARARCLCTPRWATSSIEGECGGRCA